MNIFTGMAQFAPDDFMTTQSSSIGAWGWRNLIFVYVIISPSCKRQLHPYFKYCLFLTDSDVTSHSGLCCIPSQEKQTISCHHPSIHTRTQKNINSCQQINIPRQVRLLLLIYIPLNGLLFLVLLEDTQFQESWKYRNDSCGNASFEH